MSVDEESLPVQLAHSVSTDTATIVRTRRMSVPGHDLCRLDGPHSARAPVF